MVLPDSLPLGSRTTGMADATAQPRGHDPAMTTSQGLPDTVNTIDAVTVNGVAVIADGKKTGALPGKALRRP